MEVFKRLELLIGKEGLARLSKAKVAVFGLGGVGSFAAEGLVRSGVGSLAVVDGDVVEESNFNRQLFATRPNLGKFKVDVASDRFISINSKLEIKKFKVFYCKQTENLINFSEYDYVVDAVDDLDAKVLIAVNAFKFKVPVISAMSAGNKVNATGFEVANLFETSVCPIARLMRKRLKDLGIFELKVIYSKEKPRKVDFANGVVGSTAFVPPVVGFIAAGEVIKNLLEKV